MLPWLYLDHFEERRGNEMEAMRDTHIFLHRSRHGFPEAVLVDCKVERG
jgi:hypothetical protein